MAEERQKFTSSSTADFWRFSTSSSQSFVCETLFFSSFVIPDNMITGAFPISLGIGLALASFAKSLEDVHMILMPISSRAWGAFDLASKLALVTAFL
jgi:hypothetical protein